MVIREKSHSDDWLPLFLLQGLRWRGGELGKVKQGGIGQVGGHNVLQTPKDGFCAARVFCFPLLEHLFDLMAL